MRSNEKMDSTLLLKIFLRPLFFWLAAGLVYFYLKAVVAGSFAENASLVGLAENIGSIAIWVALVPFALGSVQLLERLRMLYLWHANEINGCDFCGAPQEEKTGRYGPYRKCFRCGKTQQGWE